jgi:hypothetical protein
VLTVCGNGVVLRHSEPLIPLMREGVIANLWQ